uniref:EF-hand domain-containing protein n=1 Tax=Grammatophora oceanica TaxID=210454 RepID=A0A7S1VF95_9STRA|mmetsp:Transcript_45043/g.66894  ORF Transcript_45043/g.66894 Transcript_45043/m.66894 type:complete len:839 (+) Transcript_45043:137-2653(+)
MGSTTKRNSNNRARRLLQQAIVFLSLVGIFAALALSRSSSSSPRNTNDGDGVGVATSRWLNGDDGEQHYDDEEENDDGHHSSSNGEHVFSSSEEDIPSTFVVCIVLGLLILTMMFELGKEYLEEIVEEDMEPIIEKLFGEMTVLGFLSMVTFFLSEFGFFEWLALKMYHDEEEDEELIEIFEVVHFAIFFIMVFFFLQVVILIRHAMENEKHWQSMDRDLLSVHFAVGGGGAKSNKNGANDLSSVSSNLGGGGGGSKGVRSIWSTMREKNSFLSLLPFFRNTKLEEQEDAYYFYALRKEFLLDRNLEYPFEPTSEGQRLNPDFNFGRYLGLSLVAFLTNIVDVSNMTLVFFCLTSLIGYVYVILVDENLVILAWTWLGLAWSILLFQVSLERHVLQLRKRLVPEGRNGMMDFGQIPTIDSNDNSIRFQSMDYGSDTGGGANGSSSNTMMMGGDAAAAAAKNNNNTSIGYNSGLPLWCHINLDYFLETKRSWLAKTFVGGRPNRIESMYWLDRYGPKLYMLMLQANLIYTGLDFAIQGLFFCPMMYRSQELWVFCVYVALAALSIGGSMINKKHLMATLAVVCSVGTHRKLHVVELVYREEKAQNLVRALLIVYRLHRLTANPERTQSMSSIFSKESLNKSNYKEHLDQFEIQQVQKIFHAFDQNNDGLISVQEFQSMLNIFGGSVPAEAVQRAVATLDADGDGTVTEEEFLQWYAIHTKEDADILREAPQDIFRLFDQYNNGQLSIAQLKNKLDGLCLGFSVDEELVLINELDRDGSGTIGRHEFEMLFSKFNPKKLREHEQEYLLANVLPECGYLCGAGGSTTTTTAAAPALGHTLD